MNMLNKQGFMEVGWRHDVGSLSVKDEAVSERGRSDEERLVNGLKWSNGYFDHDRADNQFQIVPEIHKEEENSEKDLALLVPDEHSETGDHHHHHINDFSDSSDNRCHLRNKHEKPKRRRIEIFSDDESDGFTREVPTVTRKGSKRRRRDEMMSNKMRTLQKLLPNCHKTDKVSVLDKTIEYMKDLQLQLKVMSIMGMNPYISQATLNFGMHNHMLTAMAMAHGINLANQTTSSPLIPASNWPLPPYSNLSFPHSSLFPNFLDFSSHTMGGKL